MSAVYHPLRVALLLSLLPLKRKSCDNSHQRRGVTLFFFDGIKLACSPPLPLLGGSFKPCAPRFFPLLTACARAPALSPALAGRNSVPGLAPSEALHRSASRSDCPRSNAPKAHKGKNAYTAKRGDFLLGPNMPSLSKRSSSKRSPSNRSSLLPTRAMVFGFSACLLLCDGHVFARRLTSYENDRQGIRPGPFFLSIRVAERSPPLIKKLKNS